MGSRFKGVRHRPNYNARHYRFLLFGMQNPFSNDPRYIAQLQRVEHQISSNQLQMAAQGLNVLVKTHAKDPRLYLLGATLAQSANNQDAALKSARRAQTLAPMWPVSTIYLAELLAQVGQSEEALQLAVKALELATEQATADRGITEFLRKAAAIAQRYGAHEIAEKWLRRAVQANPDDAQAQHQLARTLIAQGDTDQGIHILETLLTQQPGNPALILNHLRACIAGHQPAKAQADAIALLELDPDNPLYAFYHELSCGKTPKAQPAALVTDLFDTQAATYDALMVGQLHYKAPQTVAALIHGWYPDDAADILDLGCGTGLLGAALGPHKGVMVGVDLSHQMVAQAVRRRVYDKFHTVNLLDALRETPADQYHVISALDAFIYVGDLSTAIPNALRILLPGGHLVFTCEQAAATDADYALPATYRYTHQRGYVEKLLQKAGFEGIELQDMELHRGAGQPVQGFLVVARKPLVAKPKVVRKRTPKATIA